MLSTGADRAKPKCHQLTFEFYLKNTAWIGTVFCKINSLWSNKSSLEIFKENGDARIKFNCVLDDHDEDQARGKQSLLYLLYLSYNFHISSVTRIVILTLLKGLNPPRRHKRNLILISYWIWNTSCYFFTDLLHKLNRIWSNLSIWKAILLTYNPHRILKQTYWHCSLQMVYSST